MTNYFTELNNVNVNDKTEKKNGLTYLSWAYAWGEIKKRHPDATYTVYERGDGCIYWTDGRTCWVKTGVTVNGLEHIEYLPVMDTRNKSIPLENVTSFEVNKAIQRSLTKACARHGLGLYIYAGEDLPEEEKTAAAEAAKPDKDLIARLEELGGNMEVVAGYYKKTVDAVTADEVRAMIERKLKNLAREHKQQGDADNANQ